MTFTVYENNKADQPRNLTVTEVADKVEDSRISDGFMPEKKINLVMADIGSFDPQTDEYHDFVDEVVDELRSRDNN